MSMQMTWYYSHRLLLGWTSYVENVNSFLKKIGPWWRHPMEVFSALLALCAGNSSVTDEFPSQRPVTRSFDIFFDLNKRLSKQSRRRGFEMPSRSLWRHSNVRFDEQKTVLLYFMPKKFRIKSGTLTMMNDTFIKCKFLQISESHGNRWIGYQQT